jgi:hypothetical protein
MRIASLIASHAHLLLSQVQYRPVNTFCSAHHLALPQHVRAPLRTPVCLCMLLRHLDRARNIPVAGRSPLTGMTNRI